jgi:tRNA (guanine37-N1)-methyltransferase
MSLHGVLENSIPPEKLSLLPRGFEVIGDIAIMHIPESLDAEKYLIAKVLVSNNKNIKTVLRKIRKINGSHRIAGFEILAGNSTATIHSENGCIYHLDIEKTYFSGKLYFERSRIANMVHDNEDILVLFCGVGPFLIPIARRRNVNITGLDNNSDACEYLKKNARVNGVETGIILGDANSLNNLFKKPFDRIVMPTPYGKDCFLNIAGDVLKPEGIVHFYTFKKDFEVQHFKRLLEEMGWKIEFFRDCGDVAPRVKRYVFDLRKNQRQ